MRRFDFSFAMLGFFSNCRKAKRRSFLLRIADWGDAGQLDFIFECLHLPTYKVRMADALLGEPC